MSDYDIHSCGYYCDRPLCVKAQRDELREKLLTKEWVSLTNEEINQIYTCAMSDMDFIFDTQAKLKEKNA